VQPHLHGVSKTPVSDTVPDFFAGRLPQTFQNLPLVMLVTGELIPVQHGFYSKKDRYLTLHLSPKVTLFLQY